jgi:hypothetical protein
MFINESFVSFIWQHGYFNVSHLTTTDNQILLIKHPGYSNIHAGPDYVESTIQIGEISWVGSVEIHVKSSDWNIHDHSSNPDYDKVILHVVWQHDADVKRNDLSVIPTLEIRDKVSFNVMEKYTKLMYCDKSFPCHPYLNKINDVLILSMLDRTMIVRLEKKAVDALRIYADTGKNWEETAYRILAKNFGFNVNKENMYLLSKLIPLSVISKHRESIFQVEALLFGMAGFLEKPMDKYSGELKYEYDYLRKKYSMNIEFLKRYQWKFLRLRPQNFPTIRIAQLAMLLCKVHKFFSAIVEFNSLTHLMELLKIRQSAYWEKHYDFGKKCKRGLSGLGISSIHNILSNTFVPVLSAYSKNMNNELFMAKAVRILEAMPAENNHIIRKWAKKDIIPKNAFESQGLIELSNSFCYKKKCLNCSLGTDILLH